MEEIRICTDCLMMAANGDVGDRGPVGPWCDADDAHLYELPRDDQWNNANTRHAARMDAWCVGAHIIAGDGEGQFSWRQCEGCGSTLGGDRHQAWLDRVNR
jgi:hypothetical protein